MIFQKQKGVRLWIKNANTLSNRVKISFNIGVFEFGIQ